MNRALKKNPILKIFNDYLYDSPLPQNISYFYSAGSLLGLSLVIQILSGILLAMNYTPQIDLAFDSVENIMRNVSNGWLIRYIHSNGASFFFIIVFFHIGRGLMYGSYINKRNNVWIVGVIIFLFMVITAFLGYVLPFGAMSLWGSVVITNLLSTIPIFGQSIVEFVWGGFSINNATVNRFFALHYLFPFLLVGLVIIHLISLHEVGSSNPLGISSNRSMINFHPYYTLKDILGFIICIILIMVMVCYYPNYLSHADNYTPADPLVTPSSIVPEWYLLPQYAILRSIPNKSLGVIGLLGSILILLTVNLTHFGLVNSISFRPFSRFVFYFFFLFYVLLGWLGGVPVAEPYTDIALILSINYFLIFIFWLPFITFLELIFVLL